MTQTTPEDWLDVGLTILASDGPESITVEALCDRLGVTKGSFYHHFEGYADFEDRLLSHFEREGTHRIIEVVEGEPDPAAKLLRLLDIVVEHSKHPDSDPEIAVRAWAHQNDDVRSVLARIDEQRISYVTSLCRELGIGEEEAKRRAQLLYAALVGCEQLVPPIRGDDLRAVFDELLESYEIDPEGQPLEGPR